MMERLFTMKHKFYQCTDSIIYYQKAPDLIVFMIDEDASKHIARWEKETVYSDEEFTCLMGAADGTPSYNPLKILVANNEVNLILMKPLNYIFQGLFKGQESQNLVDLDATNCPQVIGEPQRVVLKIEGEAYQTLRNWNFWIDKEAFAGKYTYDFYENLTFTQRVITVQDTATGETLVVDDSDSLWSS
jgi:hypothetical protein